MNPQRPIRLHDGPFGGTTTTYNEPLPEVLVMAELVVDPNCPQPGLRYHEYRRAPEKEQVKTAYTRYNRFSRDYHYQESCAR